MVAVDVDDADQPHRQQAAVKRRRVVQRVPETHRPQHRKRLHVRRRKINRLLLLLVVVVLLLIVQVLS